MKAFFRVSFPNIVGQFLFHPRDPLPLASVLSCSQSFLLAQNCSFKYPGRFHLWFQVYSYSRFSHVSLCVENMVYNKENYSPYKMSQP